MRRADTAMYLAKAAGKNRAVLAAEDEDEDVTEAKLTPVVNYGQALQPRSQPTAMNSR